MQKTISLHAKPPITLNEADINRLGEIAKSAIDHLPEVAEELMSEIERATVVAARAMPEGVVQMGSIVEFTSDDGQHRRVTLVYPGQADIAQGRVSVLTPIGTALIGLSEGQSISWTTRDGRQQELTVIAVEAPVTSPQRP
ncbi:MAG: nucleoside diphosphate kinase regulator [Parvibaculaceae bacterium]